MPGRATPPMPERLSPQWAISALTNVPAGVAGTGMHHEAGRLVDDDELIVLVNNVERYRLGGGLPRGRAAARQGRSCRLPFNPVFGVNYGRTAQGDLALA